MTNHERKGILTSSGASPLAVLSASSSCPTAGPGGALWFVELQVDRFGRMTTAGTVSAEFQLHQSSMPGGIVAGTDGAIWFTDLNTGEVGRLAL